MDTPKPRVLAITKKVDLSEIGEGWDGAYAIVKPATGAQLLEVSEFKKDKITNAAAYEYQLKTVKANLVGGSVAVMNGEGTHLVDIEPEDLEDSTEITNALYSAIMGIDLDPKGLKRVATATTAPSNDLSPTPTTSSTESPQSPTA